MLRFAFQIFLSAFLLFQVQPIVARFILPDFGGASNVWTICLVFFQVFLLLGYLYAYLLGRWLPPFKQALVHTALVLLAIVAFLPLDVGAVQSTQQQSPQMGIVLLLLASVGLPYALISSSGPLFQNWFRSQYPDKNPYRLYALSNVGSLLGLLSYPFLIEPRLSLQHQAMFWSAGFLLYFIWTLACLWSLRNVAASVIDDDDQSGTDEIGTADSLVWMCLAGTATMLLLATTNKITMDVASVPFLWILPLTLYLLSFIICFDRPAWYDRRVWVPLFFLTSIVGLKALLMGGGGSFYFQLSAYLGVLFVGCMVCHGELYRLRPNPRLLTRYYLVISLGGALGGIFVALVAPNIFSDYFELHLSWVALFIISGLCIFATTQFKRRFVDIGAQICWTLWVLCFGMLLYTNTNENRTFVVEQIRGFYGVLKIESVDLPDDHPSGADQQITMKHGTIIHGTEYIDDGAPVFIPTAYFTKNSGIGLAIGQKQKLIDRPIDVGVIGMGAATIAALCKKCESVSFYEIDPNVVALEEKWFSNLENVRAEGVETNVFVGDGRKLLELQWSEDAMPRYDVLVVDAFSGDSIPVHLLTREAFELYKKQLRKDGVLAVHISNTYLALLPVVASLASDLDMKVAQVWHEGSEEQLTNSSEWTILSTNESFLSGIESDGLNVVESTGGFSWTDQYSNLLGVLR